VTRDETEAQTRVLFGSAALKLGSACNPTFKAADLGKQGSLTGAPAQEIIFKNLIGEYQFSGWSLDGKGMYLAKLTPSDFMLLYAGLDGHNQVIWKRGTNGGYSIDYPVPSPDGRHLAFTIFTAESNAWLLENF